MIADTGDTDVAAQFGPGGGAFLVLSWIVFRSVKRLETLEANQKEDRRLLGGIKDALLLRFNIAIASASDSSDTQTGRD